LVSEDWTVLLDLDYKRAFLGFLVPIVIGMAFHGF